MSKGKKSENTRNRILNVAKEYFLERGYKDAHIAEIASLSYLDRRTIYRYFPSKESLLIQIVNELFEEFIQVAVQHDFEESKTGLEMISVLLDKYYRYIKAKPDLAILLGMIDVNISPSEEILDDFMRLSSYGHKLDHYLEQLIIQGQEDGSIMNRKDAKTLSITINNSLLSLVTRTAIYSPLLRSNPKAFSWKLVINQGEMLLTALRGKCDGVH